MYLDKILLFENTLLSDLSDSKEKTTLETFKVKLLSIENELKAQPDGRIELKDSGNTFVTRFSESLTRDIRRRMYS